MFYRFNAHRATKSQPTDTPTDRLPKKIAGKILFFQRGWAALMDRYSRKIPVKWLKTILIVFTLGAGTYCIYLIKGSIITQDTLRFKNIVLLRLWPFDPYEQKLKLQKQSAIGRYLDSLESKIKQDSLENPQQYHP
ncbi:hypothetical protein [Dyadobacter sp. 3J3]|uniref:hypothetical protein n=1 Tax=Dyadobacter sp. 3J3 TaxID=2606600 RepID=UPI0013567578|nr:hypothetical protein [Dyadobacter sp. 3J3]